jgi:hypothetical protein
VTPFEERIKRFEAARAQARKAIRDAEALALAAAAAHTGSSRIPKLQNAIVEVKKQLATAMADKKRLSRHGQDGDYPEKSSLVAAQQRLQEAFVGEVKAAVAKLETACNDIRWNEIHSRARDGTAEADAVLARTRAAAERAASLPIETLARKLEKVSAALQRDREAAKTAVAGTIADQKRLEATHAKMLNRARPPWESLPPHPADPAVMVRALAVQSAAVADLKQQLFNLYEIIESIEDKARAEVSRQRSG